ncbi:peptidoglycan-associated lipoprotein Pal [Blochmannia endosymbiont of Polyrhachis (Hedomyrma) turneri]|uniref:peptidoglycan-associated lipoprotein Pal n=1 Tax=Blochmannia endosymbiont of Polyrhachis (Hedomyrma) turneri TaxID=1505596 RepID=UPI00061A5F46|nr:peptidoglycan-associated lipoprotein Pal [Blochmannia endosymbiont of Polyrhachis (Hedomyrma) turneri]AKC59908.1 peptidoglycan-associated lipoprotein [Blochmannia endosymbiont of Polyrhachis (Hedomyrma) turneri]
MNIKFSPLQYIIFIMISNIYITSCCNNDSIDTEYKKNVNINTTQHTNDTNPFVMNNITNQIRILKNINTIYFDLDQYNILPQFFQILHKHADFLCKNEYYKIVIEGHADERGTPEYNIALGERRANSVKMYLQSLGVLDQQMSILSYGKEKPIFLGHHEDDYAKNRRVVLAY